MDVHTIDTAPEAASGFIEKAHANYGFLPNLLGVMASAPPLLEAYMTLAGLFEKTSLTPTERQTVLLTVSAVNQCTYCVAAHTALAQMQHVEQHVIEAIREDRPIGDDRLEALRRFTEAIVTSRGWPSDQVTEAFHKAGYTPAQALEVVLGVGIKTMSNYTNHMAQTPLDNAFASADWTPAHAK